ncbi:hypothetical protein [Pimelobacter simplex]|uniref:hypothetical protein n=1 Tax=Nocardioides simplex TaxID=2045 RepID=UPI003AAA81BD
MAVRREAVRLEVEDHFTRGVLKAVDAAKKLDKALAPLASSAGRSSKSFGQAVRNVDGLGRSARRTRTDLDNMARRLRVLSSAASGLDPATASLEGARRAIGQLAPETQQAVGQLQRLPAALEGVKGQTNRDWLPGLDATLKSLELIAPRVAGTVAGVADSVGGSAFGDRMRGGMAALSMYERALQSTVAVSKNLGHGAAAQKLSDALDAGGIAAGTKVVKDGTRKRIAVLRSDLRAMSREYRNVGRAQSLVLSGMSRTSGAAQRTSALVSTTGRAAAPVAALTLAATGLGEAFGGTAAQMALMGAGFGPWGMAAGGALGAIMDVTQANKTFDDSLSVVKQSLAAGDLASAQAGLQAAQSDQASFASKTDMRTILKEKGVVGGLWDITNNSGIDSFKILKNEVEGLFGDSDVEERAKAMKKYQKELDEAARTEQHFAESQAKLAEENRMELWAEQVAGSMRTLASDVQKPTTSLDTLQQRMRDMGKADAAMGRNINKALDNGASADAVQQIIDDLGPEAGLALEQLANGGRAAARRLNRAFNGASRGAGHLANSIVRVGNEISSLPNGKPVRISAETAKAARAIRGIVRQAQQVPRTVRTDYIVNQVNRMNKIAAGSAGPGIGQHADGGTVPKTGRAYADRHLYLLADGEEVISNRHGQADRYRSLLKSINANRLADGGTAGGGDDRLPSPRRSSGGFDLPKTLKGLNEALRKSKRRLEDETEAREDLTSTMSSLRESVAGKVTSDLFGETDAWSAGGSFDDVMAKLSGDIATGNLLMKNISSLKTKGLSGEALEALLADGDASTIAGFAALSTSQLKQYQSRYGERAALASGAKGVGAAAADAVYGERKRAADARAKRLESKLDAIEKAIKAEHRSDRQARKRGSGNASRGGRKQ